MENKFKKAIEMNELYEFIRGEGDYLIYDREYGRHCILGAWEYHIIPFIDLSEGKYIKQIFQLLLNKIKQNLFSIEDMDLLLDHLFTYYYLLNANNLQQNYILDLEKDIIHELKIYEKKIIKSHLVNNVKIFHQTIDFIHKNKGLLDYKVENVLL